MIRSGIRSSAAVAVVRTVPKRFLSLEDAKVYMRSQQLQTFTEWKDWAITIRPHFVPRHPHRVYKSEGFVSYSDYVGYKKRESWICARPDRTLSEVSEYIFYPRGLAHVKTHIEAADKDFECRYLPRRLGAGLLFRHRKLSVTTEGPEGRDDDLGWCAVRVLSEHSINRGDRMRFTAFGDYEGVATCLCRPETGEMALYPNKDEIPMKRLGRIMRVDEAAFTKESKGFMDALYDLCRDISRVETQWGWIFRLVDLADAREGFHLRSLFELRSRLFRPANTSMSFPEQTAISQSLASLVLNDKLHCIFKTARRRESAPVFYVGLARNHRKGGRSYLSVDDQFDVVIASVHDVDGLLIGAFVFPKSSLARRYLEADGNGGNSRLILYPPWYETKRESSKATQKWQTEYYIDLSTTANMASSIRRFQELLKRGEKDSEIDEVSCELSETSSKA